MSRFATWAFTHEEDTDGSILNSREIEQGDVRITIFAIDDDPAGLIVRGSRTGVLLDDDYDASRVADLIGALQQVQVILEGAAR